MDLVRGTAPGWEGSEEDLRAAELGRLQSDLAERELELATLRAELGLFERVYVRALGLRYAELDGVEAEIAELLAAAAPRDEAARQAAARARARAAESEEAASWEGEPEPEEPRFVPSEGLKKLYRRVAKRVHPDLADDEEERELRQELMAEANHAYAHGDATRLAELLREWEHAPKADGAEVVELELERLAHRVEQATARLQAIAVELSELRSSDLYRLHVRVEAARRLGTDLLREMSLELDRRIAAARKRLRALKGSGDRWIGEFFAAAERAQTEKGDCESRAPPADARGANDNA